MTTTSSEDVVPIFGKGLVTYITADSGTDEIKSDNIPQAIEELVHFPLGQQLYIRPTWREVQPRPGRLQMPDYLKLAFDLAKKNSKRIGLRIQMCAPDYTHDAALPDFVLEKVPKVDLVLSDQESSASAKRYLANPHSRYQPRYDDPLFQQAFKELVGQLAAEFDGNPLIEFIDTFMYGFWGEGHTWPFGNNPFPDYLTAERTWTNMLEVQLEYFKKTPLLTNTQPDYSRVGNSELVNRTVRSNNWIRSDTIFIENEQIEALSNRPPWIAALLEQGLPGKPPDPNTGHEGISPAENMIDHVIDVGANYWSLWNFHQINAKNLMNYLAGTELDHHKRVTGVFPWVTKQVEEMRRVQGSDSSLNKNSGSPQREIETWWPCAEPETWIWASTWAVINAHTPAGNKATAAARSASAGTDPSRRPISCGLVRNHMKLVVIGASSAVPPWFRVPATTGATRSKITLDMVASNSLVRFSRESLDPALLAPLSSSIMVGLLCYSDVIPKLN